MNNSRDLIKDIPGLLIAQFDMNQKYVWVTSSLPGVVGKTPQDLIGHHPDEFFPEQNLKLFKLAWQRILQTRENQIYEDYLIQKGEMVYYSISLTPHFNKHGIFSVTLLAKDITGIWKLAENKNKIAVEREFLLRMASHDLRTPLTSLKSCMEL